MHKQCVIEYKKSWDEYMKDDKNNSEKEKIFIVEREYLGKYSIENFLRQVIKSHINCQVFSDENCKK